MIISDKDPDLKGAKPKKREKQRTWLVVLALVLVCAIAVVAYMQFGRTTSPSLTSGKPTPTPSPGQPGNPGDQAKSAIGSLASPTPSPTTVSTVSIEGFSVEPRSNGGAQVSSQVNGATSGTCKLVLTSPSSVSSTVTGQITWSGTYAFCSFDSVSGVSEAGAWKATLTATDPSGSGGSANTTFNVGGQ